MVKLVPRDYQIEGTNWLRTTPRGFLTDWPGLGKTLQVAEAINDTAIVVAPSYLVGQWYDFLQEQYPNKNIGLAEGTRKERDAVLDRKLDIYIVNYEMLHSYAMPVDVGHYVFDESHHIRNRQANKSKAAAKLVNRNPNSKVHMVSASPMWKSIDDIWMQLHVLFPKVFTSYNEFVQTFCITFDTAYQKNKVIGINKKMKATLDSILQPIMFGRTYKDVGRFLPPIIENKITLDLTKEAKKIYDDIKKSYKLQWESEEGKQQLIFSAMGALHTLRQVTMGSGKVDAIKSLIEDSGKPHVVGTWYVDHAQAIQKAIPNSVLISGLIHDPRERQKAALQAQARGQHIIATEASICEGVNLSKYKNVIMAEEHYPPGANFQFLSRVARDRNDAGADQDPVIVTYVHVKSTIDTQIHKLAKGRSATIIDVLASSLV